MAGETTSCVKGVQVLGLCRFSVPSKGAFRVHHSEMDDRRAFLYDADRLALRFIWFEHVVLPGIAGQKDPNFKMIVLLGEDFPEPWRARMLAHIEQVPQLVAEFVPAEDHRKVCAAAMARHVDPEAEVVIQFRHDDDDGVATDFVRRLRRDFRKSKGLFLEHGLMAIDYSRGLNLVDEGAGPALYPRLDPWLGIGFAVCTLPGDGNYILDFMHHVIWQHMTAITQSDTFMWVRGSHATNDTGASNKATAHFEADPGELRQVLRKQFRIDLPAFKEALRGYHDAHSGAAG